MMMNPQQEVLPPGVGRIPQWWMELTPHYILDLEEEEYRRRAEEQMAYYYAQMAAAADAGVLDANGQPILGPDGKPLGSWGGTNGWAGRSANGGGYGGGTDGPLGRNFIPGQVTPETLALLGIDANSDPNYRSYLTGAKYPPGYWEKLAELGYTGPGFSANNLAQTDFGRYGRQAEQPKHQPSWTKMKLRPTSHGKEIRHGNYDSPARSPARRVLGDSTTEQPVLALEAPPLTDESSGAPPAPVPTPTQEAPRKPKQKRIVRKVRKVRRQSSKKMESPAPEAAPAPMAAHTPLDGPAQSTPKPVFIEEQPAEQAPHRNYTHKDYYYNAPDPAPVPAPAIATTTYAGMLKLQRQQQREQQQQSIAPAQPQPLPEQAPVNPENRNPPVHHEASRSPAKVPRSPVKASNHVARPDTVVVAAPPHSCSSFEDDHSDEYEEEIIEEIIEDEEYEEVIEDYYEEDEEGGDDDDITDLQAILAAKQAELARLQAQLSQGS